ncbi:MAG: hypothetical protein J7623_25995 [Chitinophaga sp.]|uniref:hypothetical protein n=1 Tax=Chitinophaga sp. TaxID=1869181 RepID=UPI001B04323F|nr:hypothetical protein [Chitinophaga sp.]MBO9732120.1 hypothetical protein [Chitinophaga sp.]
MRIYFLIATLAIFTACHKGADLTPDPVKPRYTLPQGHQSYDDTIVAFHKQYGSYILYKFTQHDFDYNYIDKRTDTASMGDTAYIPQALAFLRTQLFNGYPETFLQKTMPYKILLARHITDTLGVLKDCAATNSMIAFGCTDSTLSARTAAELRLLRGKLHRNYMERAYRVSAIAIPDDFAASAPNSYGSVGNDNRYSLGVVDTIANYSQLNLATDYLAYIEMITSYSYTELTTPGHPLSPDVDVNGLVMKRYNIVVNYFMNRYGADLQAIGNLP